MRAAIESFLREPAIAVVGVSRGKGFGNVAARTLRAQGYRVFPVNRDADAVDGARCHPSLSAIPEPVGAVLVVVPPAAAIGIVEECARLGVRHVWLQQGSESDESIRLAGDHGIALVHHACVLMYARPRGVHRFHRWLHDLRGSRRARAGRESAGA